jgi:hypothetical protein
MKKTDGKKRGILTTCLIRLYMARIPTPSLANSQCSNINHADQARTDAISGHLATVLGINLAWAVTMPYSFDILFPTYPSQHEVHH